MSTKCSPKRGERVVTIRISTALDSKVKTASIKTHLRKSDVMRMAVDRGVDVLLEQLGAKSVA